MDTSKMLQQNLNRPAWNGRSLTGKPSVRTIKLRGLTLALDDTLGFFEKEKADAGKLDHPRR